MTFLTLEHGSTLIKVYYTEVTVIHEHNQEVNIIKNKEGHNHSSFTFRGNSRNLVGTKEKTEVTNCKKGKSKNR